MPLDVFEEYAVEYDRWFIDHHDVYLDELNRIKEAIGEIQEPVLEIGVGSGRFAAPLEISCGVEPTRSPGRMAKSRGIEIIQGRGEFLPIKAEAFQTVVMITVLCFLDHPEAVFHEAKRILKQNGVLVVTFIERGGTIAKTYLNRPEKGRFLSHARFYKRHEAEEIITKTGFTLLSTDCRMGFCILVFSKRG